MVWGLVVVFVLSVVASIALQPRPQRAKAPGLDDLQVPTAEEGREIPVLFGTRDISAPNVVWWGDLKTKKIKKTGGFKYLLGMHMVMAHGVFDNITRIRADKRVAWSGYSSGGSISINAPTLFGGRKREGGIVGTVDFAPGGPLQSVNDYLQSQLGPDIPHFYGVSSLILRKPWLGNSAYLQPWSIRAQRIHLTATGATQWYDDKSVISRVSENPGTTLDGLECVLTWFQSSYSSGNDPARMGMQFLDPYGVVLDSAYADMIAADPTIWTERTLTATTPTGTARVRVVMEMERSSGANVDGYIDDISMTIDGAPVTINNSGGETGNVIGWTRTNGFLYVTNNVTDGAKPAPHSGSYYFFGISSPNVSAFQDVTQGIESDMNPAHIIRECLTDVAWGMGYNDSDIDDDAFAAAADALHAENFGLSMLWSQQTTIEEFVKEVLKHIDASLYVDRYTGKFVLKLIRDDYDLGTLLELGPDEVTGVEDYARPAVGELVNSITIQYWDANTSNDASVTISDTALVQVQGSIVNTTLQYNGVTTGALATKIANRDLRTLSQPLLTATLYATRAASGLNIGDCFKWYWPEFHEGYLVMRVTGLGFGDSDSNVVKIICVQDAFALPSTTTVTAAPTGWTDPAPDSLEEPDSTPTGVSVISATLTTPPASPAEGDQYIVPAGATGAWAGLDNLLVTWDEDMQMWDVDEPSYGTLIYDETADDYLAIDGDGIITTPPWPTIPLEDKGDLLTFDTGVVALPVGSDGQVLVADSTTDTGLKWASPAGLGGATGVSLAVKTADQDVLNSTTLTDDSALQASLDANSVYQFEVVAFWSKNATPDYKTSMHFTGTTTWVKSEWGYHSLSAWNGTTTTQTTGSDDAFDQAIVIAPLNSYGSIRRSGIVSVGASGGTLSYRFAQNTTDATYPATTLKGSYIRVQKL